MSQFAGLAGPSGNPEGLPVTYAEFLAGKRRAAPHPIDMVVLRQVCALIDLVRHDGPGAQFEHIAAWIRADPDHVASVAIVLAAIAPQDVVEPGRVLELVAKHPLVDVRAIALEAKALYKKYSQQRAQQSAPNWVRIGHRIYDRTRRRTNEQYRRARARAQTTRAG